MFFVNMSKSNQLRINKPGKPSSKLTQATFYISTFELDDLKSHW